MGIQYGPAGNASHHNFKIFKNDLFKMNPRLDFFKIEMTSYFMELLHML